MEDKLSQYKMAMDKKAYNDAKFTERHKQSVLNRVRSTKKRTEWLPQTIGVVFTSVVILVSIYFVRDYMETNVSKTTVTPPREQE